MVEASSVKYKEAEIMGTKKKHWEEVLGHFVPCNKFKA